ncbi:MAG: AraC family transcriptional regulator, partial [Oscillospiraceae bacterium]|nr:AraC family transcriptional regulator [Oscillospiraceae bacterium]
MSISKELNARLLESAEEQRVHVEYRSEYGYYGAVAEGDIEAVKKVLVRPDNVSLYENGEYGILSKDRLRNIRYHFVVAAALITRLCVEKGLERELAYTMSDLYIEKMDRLQ